jgi:preprotein translocase subunit SecB
VLKISLSDTALLRCAFEHRLSYETDETPEADRTTYDAANGYPDEQLLQLSVQSSFEENEVVAWIEGKVDDKRVPFRLSFEMAFLYSVPDDEELPPPNEIEPTLVWIAFPYMRELIADLTGRSPVAQYFLPPLTRLPQPDPPPDSG